MPFETDVRESVAAAPAAGAIRARAVAARSAAAHGLSRLRPRHRWRAAPTMDPRALCDEWRVANDHYYELETQRGGDRRRGRVPGAAGGDAAARRRARRATRTSATPATACRRPSAWSSSTGWSSTSRTSRCRSSRRCRRGSRRRPTPEGLFRFCQPLERRDPPVTVRRLGDRRYLFASDFDRLPLPRGGAAAARADRRATTSSGRSARSSGWSSGSARTS